MSASIRSGAPKLSERDKEVLRLLARFRLLTGNHLERLVITEGSSVTAARRARSVLKRLSDQAYIGRLDRQIGGIHAGSQGFVYRLRTKGSSALARLDGGTPRRTAGEPGERFVAHILAIAEQYVRLVERQRTATMPPVVFHPEPACWRRYSAPRGGTAVLKPDAFVRTADADYDYTFFLEVDRATESPTTIRRKCQAYIDYWRSGSEQRDLGIFPQVLWSVPDERRRERIARVLHHLPPDGRTLFAVVTAERTTDALCGIDETNPPERR
jgi:hypothetical protein